MNKFSKQLFDKRQRFSIRRLTVGVASVAIGGQKMLTLMCTIFCQPQVIDTV